MRIDNDFETFDIIKFSLDIMKWYAIFIVETEFYKGLIGN